MQKKKPNIVQMTVKVSADKYEAIEKLSAKTGQNMSEVVRKFIDKGLDVQGYQDNVDFISAIVRQEVKLEIQKQANRLASMMFKIGIISAGGYFLSCRVLTDFISPSMHADFKWANEQARKLGIEYMKTKGSELSDFFSDDVEIEERIDKLSFEKVWGDNNE